MKRKTVLFVLACFMLIQAHAQSRYNRLYNTGDTLPPFPSSFCFSLLPEPMQFIVAGDNYSPTRTAYVAGFSYNGVQLWQKDLHFAGNFNISPGPSTMLRLSAGTYAMLGSDLDLTINPKIVVEQPYLYFFNDHGDSLRFVKFVDSFESRRMLSLTGTSDHFLVAAGVAYSKSFHYSAGLQIWINDSFSCYVSRFDTLGHLIWSRPFLKSRNGIGGMSIAKKVIAGENGSIIVAGLAEIATLPGNERYSHFVTKLDSSGNILWTRNYRYNKYDEWEGLNGIDVTPDGKGGFYFLTGRSVIPKSDPRSGPESSVLYYGRCNDQGDTLWTSTFARPGGSGGYEWTEGTAIRRDEHGNLLLMGTVHYYWDRPTLVIADTNGRVKSFRQYRYRDYSGNTGVNQRIYDICRTPTQQLLMGGNVSNTNLADWDSLGSYTWLIQTDSLGCLEDGCAGADTVYNQPVAISKMSIQRACSLYPNPANDLLRVQGLSLSEETLIEVADLQGRIVISKILVHGQNEINISSIRSGTYLLLLYEKGNRQAFKFFKQ